MKKKLIRYVAISENCYEEYSIKKEALKDILSGSWGDEEVTLYKTDRPVTSKELFIKGASLFMWEENVVCVCKNGIRWLPLREMK